METYFIQQGIAGPIKIGKSINPKSRLAQLQTSHPDQLNLLATLPVDIEEKLHKEFKSDWIRGEWFEPSEDLLEFITRCDSTDPLTNLLARIRRLIWIYEEVNRDELGRAWIKLASYGHKEEFKEWNAFALYENRIISDIKRQLTRCDKRKKETAE